MFSNCMCRCCFVLLCECENDRNLFMLVLLIIFYLVFGFVFWVSLYKMIISFVVVVGDDC